MENIIVRDGLYYEVQGDEASVELTNEFALNELIVPSEIDGIPVRSFKFSDGSYRWKGTDYSGNIKYFSNYRPGYWEKIKLIKIPAGVSSLKLGNFFEHRVRFEIDEAHPYYYSDGSALYSKDRRELKSFLAYGDEEYTILPGCKKISHMAFMKAKKLKHIIFPEGLEYIGQMAFEECEELMELELPEGLVMIDFLAFTDCRNIEKIRLPSTLEKLGSAAFRNVFNPITVCFPKALRELDIHDLPEWWTLILSGEEKNYISRDGFILSKDGKKLVRLVGPFEGTVFTVPEGITEITASVFTVDFPYTIEKIVLPKSLHTIGSRVFFRLEKLKEINLENVREIRESAFSWCWALKTLTIRKNIRHIGKTIANELSEIHIYDDIEFDINADTDFSDSGYTLYVHSAETDEIKYAVPIIGREYENYSHDSVHNKIIGMFRGGVSFDFKEFDSLFFDIPKIMRNYREYLMEIFNAGMLRLKYGYELDEAMRGKYKERLNELGLTFVKGCISNNKIEELFVREIYDFLSIDDMLALIDLSAEERLTELTAFLMRICNEKKTKRDEN